MTRNAARAAVGGHVEPDNSPSRLRNDSGAAATPATANYFLRFPDDPQCRFGADVVVPPAFITVEGPSLARISERGDFLGFLNRSLASPPIALCKRRRLTLLRFTMRRTTCSA
jgi:hypothetical protein